MQRRLLGCALALVLVMAASIGAAGAKDRPSKAPDGLRLVGVPKLVASGTVAKSASGRLAQSDKSLLRRTDSKVIPVMVKLDYDAVASYRGGIAGLAATSPSVTGRSLSKGGAAVDAYRAYVAGFEKRAVAAMKSRVPGVKVLGSFRNAYGGLSVSVAANRAKDLLAADGVAAVQENTLEKILTDNSPDFIGATSAWTKLGGQDKAGEGVVVGVLDTGIWPEHDSYIDNGIADPRPGETFGCEFGDGTEPDLGDPFTCNDKLLGAYAFVDDYMLFVGADENEYCHDAILPANRECSARDSDGHGTHTSSTAAGSRVDSAEVFGVERGPISGIAPGASVIMYRVCLDLGCFSSDSVDAVDQAIVDGIDVINFSISGGDDPYSDPVELAFLDAFDAGITVNASAGNSGPGEATVAHNSPWVTTVGASTQDRQFQSHLMLTNTADAETYEADGASITSGLASATEVVKAEDITGYADPLCQTDLPNSVNGKVVVCQRGGNARVEKSYHVSQGGGVGMILYNALNQDILTDNHWVPTVHIDGEEPAASMLAYIDSKPAGSVRAVIGEPAAVADQGDVMAEFSSRGPGTDFLKPDVTAPGVQILAGHTPTPFTVLGGPPGELFQAIAGTSMSSPHSAGVSALVKAAHPGWSPAQIRSAMMLSSIQSVTKEDGTTPADPFDMGAGSLRANRAIKPALVLNESSDDFAASASDEQGRIDLNIASINADPMPGTVTTKRKVKNVTGARTTFDVSTSSEAGSIFVSPSHFTLDKGKSKTLTITIDAEDAADGQHFGSITINPARKGYKNSYMPVAFVKGPGEVTMTHTCHPTDIQKGDSTDCQVYIANFSSSPADYTLNVKSSNPDGLKVKNWSSGTATAKGFKKAGTLTPAEPPTIDAITPGGTGFGYLPLADFGVTPVPDASDESFHQFAVTPYEYGSEPYDVVTMTANGYAMAGDSTDVDYVAQDVPDPGVPNNVIGPYWTDLNPAEGGNLYAAELTDGVANWVVLEWEDVSTFGSGGADNETFQIWIETTNTQAEPVTWAYGVIDGADGGAGLTFGAENRDGSSGAQLAAPPASGEEYTVQTSPPTAGGTKTITYEGKGLLKGLYSLKAILDTSVDRGTTVVPQYIEVK